MLSRCYFDKEKTRDGHEALKQYRREYDERRNRFRDTPLHDWTSHAADAFSILPNIESNVMKRRPMQTKKFTGSIRIKV